MDTGAVGYAIVSRSGQSWRASRRTWATTRKPTTVTAPGLHAAGSHDMSDDMSDYMSPCQTTDVGERGAAEFSGSEVRNRVREVLECGAA
jgi:hypothetical protein